MGRIVLLLLLLSSLVAAKNLLFVSFHGNEVIGFDVSTGTEAVTVEAEQSSAEFRGMAQVGSVVYLAQAKTRDSEIDTFNPCQQATTETVFSGGSLDHPYGVAVSGSMMYVSNQDNFQITTYNLTQQREVRNNFPQVDTPRGVATDVRGNVYVCSKGQGGVQVFDGTGRNIGFISKSNPIGVHTNGDWVYVSSGDQDSHVEAFNATTRKSLWTANFASQHGAGLAIVNNVLYVVDQDSYGIIKLDALSGKYLGTFVTNLQGTPEQLLAVQC